MVPTREIHSRRSSFLVAISGRAEVCFCFGKSWLSKEQQRRGCTQPKAFNICSKVPHIQHGQNYSISFGKYGRFSLPYHTRPLSSETSTRRLTLQSSSGDDAIKCSLMSIDLDTNPRYEALSYCWVSPANSQSVLLNGLLVGVRENLWQAVWHLRLSHQDRVMWIDALCINQENTLEQKFSALKRRSTKMKL